MIGKKVSLRALEKEDLKILYQWENDMELWTCGTTLVPISKYTLELFIRDSGRDIYETKQLRLMVVQNTDAQAIGTIDIFDLDPLHGHAAVGILIVQPYRHQGYASEVLTLIKRYAFEVLHLHQLYCTVDVCNQDSMNLFKHRGFQETGRRKEWLRYHDQWHDVVFLQCMSAQ